ncbi:MAG TPA: GTP-binding protein [Gammaproteobacteria bacterium]|nr:GTP-binding protein [Gammaproteobacteria bacterium]
MIKWQVRAIWPIVQLSITGAQPQVLSHRVEDLIQHMPPEIRNVPTNIISGFLGTGKTTAILDLFTKKPDTEKWAVLVNEFGKVGIDGQIYRANDITVKEIPGGCMCCAQGLPLQVAVNRLLGEARPDRLIIESSGVGHPAGVLKTLKGKGFEQVLTLRAGICLLDPEYLINPAYQNNERFKEQIQFADILIANKTDLASTAALHAFALLSQTFDPAKVHIASTTKGRLNTGWLDYQHRQYTQEFTFETIPSEPSSGQSSEWRSHTFHYPEETLFDITALKHWLKNVGLTRLKGIIRTADTCYLLNYVTGQVEITPFDHQGGSYIEVIDPDLNIDSLKSDIRSCISG